MDLFTNPDLFRYIDKYTDLRSLCDKITDVSALKNVPILMLPYNLHVNMLLFNKYYV